MRQTVTAGQRIERVKAVLADLAVTERRLDDFTPWDNIPWEAHAEQLLRCRLGEGFVGLRPPARVAREVDAFVETLSVRQGAAVLDLGCGPGMYANRLAARGHAVIGIDIAQPVLAYAQAEATARGLACDYRCISFLEMDFRRRFEAALLTNSIVNHLAIAQLQELLRRVHGALRPGGRFACEIIVEPRGYRDREPRETRKLYVLPYSPWSNAPHCWVERNLTFPKQRQRVTHHIIMPEQGEPTQYWSRFALHSRDFVGGLLEEQGFEVEAWYDQDLRSSAPPDAELVWVVARAGAGGRP